jgi:probable phosphoglycerate mutase
MMMWFPRRTAVRAMVTSSTSSSSSSSIINHLLHRNIKLTQSYYALRHGQSLANVEKIISSDPQISTVQHCLSDMGKLQATKAGEMFMEDYHHTDTANDDYEGVAIFSSDFTRARETASIFAKSFSSSSSSPQYPQIPIYNNDIVLETKLRERYFGVLNGGPDTKYQSVWDIDCTDPDHEEYDVESANSVLERTTRLICDLDDMLSSSATTSTTSSSSSSSTLENDHEGDGKKKKKWKVILVAHGDVLQILQTGFLLHEDASKHRSLDHLETATIRKLY